MWCPAAGRARRRCTWRSSRPSPTCVEADLGEVRRGGLRQVRDLVLAGSSSRAATQANRQVRFRRTVVPSAAIGGRSCAIGTRGTTLARLFIVSEVEGRRRGRRGADDATLPHVAGERTHGVKCERCWRAEHGSRHRPASAGVGEVCQLLGRRPPQPRDGRAGRRGQATSRPRRADAPIVVVRPGHQGDRAGQLPSTTACGRSRRLLDLTHVRNTGAAFGLLNAADFPYKAVLLRGRGAIGLGGDVVIYAAPVSAEERLARVGLALILGGAAGNLIDRVAVGRWSTFVDVLLADLALLGVQRRRLGHHGRRGVHDSRYARGGHPCIQDCLSSDPSARSPSTRTASCWRPRTCSA